MMLVNVLANSDELYLLTEVTSILKDKAFLCGPFRFHLLFSLIKSHNHL